MSEGQRTAVYPVLSDGSCAHCLRGMPSRCLSRGLVGIVTDGGYAELVKVPASNLMPIGELDFKAAAAMPVNFGTAWNGLASRAKVVSGDTVLVWGAAGGVGYAATQIAKLLGAKVVAVVGDDKKANFVESQGADLVVNSRTQSVVEAVRTFTGGLGASVVVDHVGGDTWGASVECLARGGRMVTLGLTSGPKSEVDVRRVYQEELAILGTWGQSREDIQLVMKLASDGKLKPSIFHEFPLSSASEAHRTLESRDVQGKILLLP